VAESTWLGGLFYLPKGTYVGYNSYATNRDPGSWGPDADDFRPERWGTTDEEIFMKYRSAKARAELISFHGGSRACLGEKFTLLQMRVTLCALVKAFQWELDPEWEDRMTAVCALTARFAHQADLISTTVGRSFAPKRATPCLYGLGGLENFRFRFHRVLGRESGMEYLRIDTYKVPFTSGRA